MSSEEERPLPQPIEVDLEVETDLARAGRTDDVADTIDYGPLVELCAGRRGAQLLPPAGGHRGRHRGPASWITTPALAVTVRVRKLAVPVDADLDWAQVELRRERPAGSR